MRYTRTATQMRVLTGLAALSAGLAALGALAQPGDAPARPPRPGGPDTMIPAPHPIITEILYRVPPDPVGDANQDGRREATGDEFVEIYNPHDQPINLKGYTISDSQAGTEDGVSFTFPSIVLQPKQIALAFNGYRADFAGPWGNSTQAPGGPNPLFHDAYTFTMGMTRRTQAFADDGDFVLLSAPDGSPIDAVVWGSPASEPPAATLRVSRYLAAGRASAQRIGANGDMINHFMIDNRFYSPGQICTTAHGCDPMGQQR